MELNYNIGAGDKPIEGWINIDIEADVFRCLTLADRIYTSHFLEYFDKTDVARLLSYWYSCMKDGALLQISVPDFAKIVKIYNEEGIIMDGALYGKMDSVKSSVLVTELAKIIESENVFCLPKQGNTKIYHKSTFDKKTLREALLLAGFRNITEFEPWHNDCSQDPISLNLQCRK